MTAENKKYVLTIGAPKRFAEKGFALFTTMVIVIIVGIVAVSSLGLTEMTEILAGNSIQRSRAFHAAEGGLIEAERYASNKSENRVFSSSSALDGIFARDSVDEYWWRDDEFMGEISLDTSVYPGVVEAPVFVVEEIGNYVTDGGSGIVSMDRGSAAYGRLTSSGKEVVLYKLQSNGVGSTSSAKAVVESLYVQTQ